MTIQNLIASFKCHRDEFTPPENKYAEGAQEAWECAIEEAEKVEKDAHIICLAAAKHYRLRPAMTAKAWILSLVKIGNRNEKFVAKGETYWEAERQAREYLNGIHI